MELILTQSVDKLGNVGDIVTVKNGYGRNFLLPQEKALRATAANKELFEKRRVELEKENAAKIKDATQVSEKINAKSFVIIKQASDSSHLYGSVSNIEIADLINEKFNTHVTKQQIQIQKPIKMLGIYEVRVRLYANISPIISINVARSQQEAKAQEKAALAPSVEQQIKKEVAAIEKKAETTVEENAPDTQAETSSE